MKDPTDVPVFGRRGAAASGGKGSEPAGLPQAPPEERRRSFFWTRSLPRCSTPGFDYIERARELTGVLV
jgi:hypothetical protein